MNESIIAVSFSPSVIETAKDCVNNSIKNKLIVRKQLCPDSLFYRNWYDPIYFNREPDQLEKL